jgi:hypothetical protein
MEAATRPALEPLSDLPVEEPLDASPPRKDPRSEPPAPPVVQPPAAGTEPPRAEQTGLNFVDPEMFLAAEQQPTAVPVGVPDAMPEVPRELELEDPVVDDLLTAPPPPVTARPAELGLTETTPPTARSERAPDGVPERSARVPIAKTASLSTAATKLAAASQRATVKTSPKPAAPSAATVRSAQAGPAPAEAPAANVAAPSSPKGEARPAAKLDAPSLASWASARAAAHPAVKAAPAAAPVARPAPPTAPPAPAAPFAAAAPSPARATAPKGAPSAPAPLAAPAHATQASPPMDRDFIARNQVIERYLSGRLPLKGATDFERFCSQHPELLDEIGLPERVNAGLRLLEASGKPEPWQEDARPAWQKPHVTLGLAAVVVVLGVALAILAGTGAGKSRRIAELQKQATERALDPATHTREIRLLPSRSGASNAPAITIGGGSTELADLKIDESRSAYHMFRVTIDRIDQGRVGVISNLAKDSNGHLRIALNSSALGPGNYQLTLEGLDWRGDPQPDSWITIGVAR